jgi:hypothetical protein
VKTCNSARYAIKRQKKVITPARDVDINFLPSINGVPDFIMILLSVSHTLLIQVPGKNLFFYSKGENLVHLFLPRDE